MHWKNFLAHFFFFKGPKRIWFWKKRERNPEKTPKPLVIPRPQSLEERYERLDYAPLSDEIFLRLKRRIYQELDQLEKKPKGPVVFREAGKLTTGERYFYLKAAGDNGWLFERQGSGWVVSPALKDASRNLFVRENVIFDKTELFLAKNTEAMPRVRAQGLGSGSDLLSLAVYEQKLLRELGLS